MSQQTQPYLSIVTPTLGNFSEYWLQQLLAIKGDENTLELILVYPPDAIEAKPKINDPRVKIFFSMFKGETSQRFIGLINAKGKYVLALDDDDYLHPQIVSLASDYFNHFPDSFVLRIFKKGYDYQDEKAKQPWGEIPTIKELNVSNLDQNSNGLRPLSIAPLNNRFRPILLFYPYAKRKDHHGRHMENFNNRVWLTAKVQEALADLSKTMRFADPLTWIASWGFDRLLCLYIQAKLFGQVDYIGHEIMSSESSESSEQVRYIGRPYSQKTTRLIFPSDALLAIRFPQYGYFWNLFFEEFYNAIKTKIKQFIFHRKTKNI